MPGLTSTVKGKLALVTSPTVFGSVWIELVQCASRPARWARRVSRKGSKVKKHKALCCLAGVGAQMSAMNNGWEVWAGWFCLLNDSANYWMHRPCSRHSKTRIMVLRLRSPERDLEIIKTQYGKTLDTVAQRRGRESPRGGDIGADPNTVSQSEWHCNGKGDRHKWRVLSVCLKVANFEGWRQVLIFFFFFFWKGVEGQENSPKQRHENGGIFGPWEGWGTKQKQEGFIHQAQELGWDAHQLSINPTRKTCTVSVTEQTFIPKNISC